MDTERTYEVTMYGLDDFGQPYIATPQIIQAETPAHVLVDDPAWGWTVRPTRTDHTGTEDIAYRIERHDPGLGDILVRMAINEPRTWLISREHQPDAFTGIIRER